MIIITDKPAKMTSHDVVSHIKRSCGRKYKVGHTGTLDPMCTGVLPILLGNDTKLSDLLPSGKSYVATLLLGKTSDTEDITGEILSECEVVCGEAELIPVLEGFVGESDQIPPMYSAVKIGGKKLYELARQGIETERASRRITVFGIEYLGMVGENEYKISVDCSAGTYIRTLIADIGKKLGCGAVMTSLRRTRSNGFTVDEAHTLEEVKTLAENGELESISVPAEKALETYPCVTVPADGERYYLNGGVIGVNRLSGNIAEGLLRVYSESGDFLGLGKLFSEGVSGLKSVWRHVL